MTDTSNTEVLRIKFSSVDEERRIVYGVVYTPYMLDSYQGFSDVAAIERAAYRYMQLELSKTIDNDHNNIPNGSYPVESFIARDNDPDFPSGAWVLGTKVVDDALWEKILSGEYNGYSLDINVNRRLYDVVIDSHPVLVGETEEFNGHKHTFFVEINSKGDIIRGNTSIEDGHSHKIVRNSITSVYDNHSHKIIIQNQ